MKKSVLEIKNLTKYYGSIRGVEDLSLELKQGEIFGFIGPNGAGKSTTIRSIMNLVNKKGKVLINGVEFSKDLVDIKEKIGYLPSEIYLYDDLSVKEILDYHEKFYKKDIHNRRVELVNKFLLDETKNIEDLSLGNLKKLGIVLAFMHDPEIIILDEATSGLDPIMQNVFFELLKEEKERGKTIFYSTHVLSEVSKICDRVGIIKEGHLIEVKDIKEICDENSVSVTVKSKEVDKIIKEFKLDIKPYDNTIKFFNKLDSNLLLKELSKYKVDKVLIEEPTLEDMFLNYYE